MSVWLIPIFELNITYTVRKKNLVHAHYLNFIKKIFRINDIQLKLNFILYFKIHRLPGIFHNTVKYANILFVKTLYSNHLYDRKYNAELIAYKSLVKFYKPLTR